MKTTKPDKDIDKDNLFLKTECSAPRTIFPELTIDELDVIFSTTIKFDRDTKLILFLVSLLNYTQSDQQNVAFSGPSSSGKTYITEEILNYFPPEDVEKKHYTSPQAFFYRQDCVLLREDDGTEIEPQGAYIKRGVKDWLEKNPRPERGEITEWRNNTAEERSRLKDEWQQIPKVRFIDLRGKIIAFLDQPHFRLMERLRPLLSHDEKSGLYTTEIAGQSSSGEIKTLKIMILGHPTFVFLSTRLAADEQEQNRNWLLSTDISQEKLYEALHLLAERLQDKGQFEYSLQDNDGRNYLKERIKAIKTVKITNIVVRKVDMKWLLKEFLSSSKRLTPRATRDFDRLATLGKALALLNLWHREEKITKDIEGKQEREITVSREDLKTAWGLYRPIAEANIRGLPPLLWKFWVEYLEPKLELTSVLYEDFRTLYYQMTGSYLGKSSLSEMVTILNEIDLIDVVTDVEDRRRKKIVRRTLLPQNKKNIQEKFTMSKKEWKDWGAEALRRGEIKKVGTSEYIRLKKKGD